MKISFPLVALMSESVEEFEEDVLLTCLIHSSLLYFLLLDVRRMSSSPLRVQTEFISTEHAVLDLSEAGGEKKGANWQ